MSRAPAIQVTTHAKLRWTMRSGDLVRSLTSAWEDGLTVTEHGDIQADEVRLHEPTGTLIVRQGSHLTTVLRANYADEQVQAAIEEVTAR